MNPKQDPSPTAKAKEPAFTKERSQFRALLVSNPNYFGNLKVSPFPPVVNIQGNTNWEEIGCVGFQPQLDRLEAVVFIKQPTGYGGDVCSAGTPEYVRFYISFDNGTTWQDQGLESFTAYNIPEGTSGTKQLEYAVTRQIDPPKKFCFVTNLALVRAILSWNAQPPPNDPNFTPVFGSVHDTHIQIDGWKIIVLAEALKALKVKVPKELETSLDLTQKISVPEAKTLTVAELQKLYRGKNVQPHRYALAEVQKLIDQPELTESLMAPGFEGVFGKLDIDLSDLVGKLFPTDGDTGYEELVCVGLNNSQSALVGVIRVKLSSGYSGGPCTAGSREYVTFWGDFNDNGTFETCLGTASVRVYDIENIPSAGLEYSVYLPVDLTKYHQPCEQGPRVVKIRAILSWQVPPPCSNSNYVPIWGNREETLVHITGPVVAPGDFRPFLYDINGVGVCNIDQSSGLAKSGDNPFGNVVYITGEIPAAVALTVPDTLKYKVWVTKLNPLGPPQPLANSFDIMITQGFGIGPAFSFPFVQSIDPNDGFYTYREYGTPVTGGWRRVSSLNRLLAVWITNAPMTGLWEIRIEAKDTLTNTTYLAGETICLVDGSTRQNVNVWLDEVGPTADVIITGFTTPADPNNLQTAGDCATFTKGVTVHGTYSVADEHFGSLTLTVQPAGPANGAAVNPSLRTHPPVPDAGESGDWTLDTTPMDPCGYVVRLSTSDRTIVGFGNGTGGGWFVGRYNEDFSGFCLKAEE